MKKNNLDITIKAHAKINLALDIVGKREDGYHNLRMIMQTVFLHDQISIKKVDNGSLKLVCDNPRLPTDERNLVYKAAIFFKNEYNLSGGMFISLKKNIPVSAGLGGGSSDCAAVIVGINRIYKLGLSQSELIKIGERFGADVPFCILGGTALAEGKGEILTPLPPHPPVSVVIAKPPESISTSFAFKSFDILKKVNEPDIDQMISNLKKKDIEGIASGFSNVLEAVGMRECPSIARIKESFMEFGALGTLMSGSGPSVFAYFINQRQACNAIKEMQPLLPNVRLFLTSIFR